MKKKLLSLYGLKWNPFSSDVPPEALYVTSRIDSFVVRVEHLVREGGFAAVLGDSGVGKSSAMRILEARLSAQRDVVVGALSRPQAGQADFYRELGDLFRVQLNPHNRWAGTKALRQCWQSQIAQVGFHPVLLLDEAQETRPEVLNELRLLASTQLDSRVLLTVVLAGDQRLCDKLRLPELLPLDSRLRVRLLLEPASREDLSACLLHAVTQAGCPTLLTPELVATVCEHAAGNYRVLWSLCNDLLLAAVQREAPKLDEKLFFDLVTPTQRSRAKSPAVRR